MINILAEARKLHLFRPLDVQFAYMLAAPSEPALMLASACLSADTSIGHVCLPLSLLTPARLFNGRMPLLAQQAWVQAGSLSINEWEQQLLASNAVSDGSYPTPLVLDNQRLYLQRIWRYECIVAKFLNQSRPLLAGNDTAISSVLTYYFQENNNAVIDWQKVAIAIAVTNSIALIMSVHDTEKISLIIKIIATLLHLSNNNNIKRILIAALNGKTVARLNESISLALQYLQLDRDKKRQLSYEVMTLYRLLGAKLNSQQMRFHKDNPLHVDVLIIDEALKIDLTMLANIILALPPKARVVFLGGCCHVSSVTAGAVLGDICQLAKLGYSTERHAELERLTGYALPKSKVSANYIINDSLCLLHKNFLDKTSNINRLAQAINVGNVKEVLDLVNINKSADIIYSPLCQTVDYQNMIKDCINGYKNYLKLVHNHDTPAKILNTFKHFRLLCALHEGKFGMLNLNKNIELALKQEGFIFINNEKHIYAGRPVIILRNATLLDLYNNDIGILLLNEEQIPLVYFSLPNGKIKAIPINKLPEHETAFAITVQKSQESEFSHVALVLPDHILPMLTRELLYSAIICAKDRLSLYVTNEVLQFAIENQIKGRSGLVKKLATRINEYVNKQHKY